MIISKPYAKSFDIKIVTVGFIYLVLKNIEARVDIPVYKKWMVLPSSYRIHEVLNVDGTLSCANACSRLQKEENEYTCNAIRFNASDAMFNCQLLSHNEYDEGQVEIYTQLRYSPDGCLINFRRNWPFERSQQFCKGQGGKLPELKKQKEIDNLEFISSGSTWLGLHDNGLGTLYWSSTNQSATDLISAIPFEISPDSNSCFFYKIQDEKIFDYDCGRRENTICQFC